MISYDFPMISYALPMISLEAWALVIVTKTLKVSSWTVRIDEIRLMPKINRAPIGLQ